jgi:glutaconate CoA-transferase subunit B
MEPEPESNEFVVTALHPGVTREQVRQNTGWAVRLSSDVRETEPPARHELEALRDLNARTAQAHAGRAD